ncbi:MAG: zinc ribbon domain-containing protein [Gammaproteobacteria bacterium]|nr:zinc ribbon domain-containing protein [Gammaproteobacteria bacterium]
MYSRCPKCGYQRRPSEQQERDICPGCGLVFSKWMRRRFRPPEAAKGEASDRPNPGALYAQLTAPLFYIGERVVPLHFWSRLATFLLFVVWGWSFIWMEVASNEIGASFMHLVNLVFHEAGHVLFIPLGEFMTILGGSLLQVVVPLLVTGAFLWRQHDPFAASIGLWWTGQSMMDIAPYINDARDRQLVLLGGGTGEERPWMHDWYNLLGQMKMLEQDHRLAALVDLAGELTMLLAMCWGALLLYRQYQRLSRQ